MREARSPPLRAIQAKSHPTMCVRAPLLLLRVISEWPQFPPFIDDEHATTGPLNRWSVCFVALSHVAIAPPWVSTASA